MGKATKQETSWTGTILLGVVLAGVGVVVIYDELGRPGQYNSAQAIFLASLLAVAGVVVAGYGWWRRRTPDA